MDAMTRSKPRLDCPRREQRERLQAMTAGLLADAIPVLASVDGTVWSAPGSCGSVGAQIRHVLEFVSAYLDGVPSGRVDYDRRPRDPALEGDRGAACARMRDLVVRLRESECGGTGGLDVRMDEDDETTGWTRSSVERELRFLASHTVHHFAIVRLLLEARGLPVAAEFGVAPSTLRHRRALALARAR